MKNNIINSSNGNILIGCSDLTELVGFIGSRRTFKSNEIHIPKRMIVFIHTQSTKFWEETTVLLLRSDMVDLASNETRRVEK
jgi:hypothetical protein